MLMSEKGKRIKSIFTSFLRTEANKTAIVSWSKCPEPVVTEYCQLVREELGGGVMRGMFSSRSVLLRHSVG